MKIIVGLGNPGKEYEGTRHNAGFSTMDKILKELNLSLDKNKFNADYTIYFHNGEKVLFVKPLTYMNESGTAVKALMDFYQIDKNDLLVIHDDMDLPVGKIRIRYQGSSAGQKGMGSIITHLGTSDLKRIRIGISNDKNIDVKDYVLGKFSKEEKELVDPAMEKASKAAIAFLDEPFEDVMSKYNG